MNTECLLQKSEGMMRPPGCAGGQASLLRDVLEGRDWELRGSAECWRGAACCPVLAACMKNKALKGVGALPSTALLVLLRGAAVGPARRGRVALSSAFSFPTGEHVEAAKKGLLCASLQSWLNLEPLIAWKDFKPDGNKTALGNAVTSQEGQSGPVLCGPPGDGTVVDTWHLAASAPPIPPHPHHETAQK